MEVWHLAHSTFVIRSGRQVLVFDYWLDDETSLPRCLETGVFSPNVFAENQVYVFSSHKHEDHFSPLVFNWREQISGIQYILSADIPKRYEAPDVYRLKPHAELQLDDMRIKTLKSTDAGVAFLIRWQGKTIYFAGDLHLWLWAEETKSWNHNMKARFEAEMALLKDEVIDIAFIPFDIRQEQHAADGLKWYMAHIDANTVIAMHFGHAYRETGLQIAALQNEPWFSKLLVPEQRGQCFQIDA